MSSKGLLHELFAVEETKLKLKDNDALIFDIALSVDFESLTTFNRVFKKRTGKTPTEYKKEISC